MDLKSMKSVWESYLEVQEGKKLSAKQKKHMDKDNDGDIDGKDMEMLKKEETESVEEANEPADCITPAPTRKGDKKNSQASEIKGKAVKESTMLQDFASMLEAIEEVQGKSKKHPQKDFPLGQSDLDPEASAEHKKHTKGGTDPEGLLDKESKSGEDFVKLHQKSDEDLENKEYEGHDDVSKAGRAVKSQSPKRSGGDRSNPNQTPMPKLTKEEVLHIVEGLDEEQLDELSTTLVRRYKKKADAQTTSHMSKIDNRDPNNPKRPSAASHDNFKKRMKGSGMAHDKLGGKYAKVPAKKPTNEDVDQFVDSLSEEQLAELSTTLVRRYKKKADAQTTDHMSKIDNRDPKNPKRPSAASDANFKKRMKGSNMAHDKLGGKYAKVPAKKPTK